MIRAALVIAAMLASVPGTAIAYALPEHGPISIPRRWWNGTPAPVGMRVGIAVTTAAVTALIAVKISVVATAVALAAMAVVCVVLTVTDLRRHRLPHRLTAIGWVAASFAVTVAVVDSGRIRPAIEAIGAAACVAMVLLGVALVLPGQLGLGDVNLACVVAFSLGWAGWPTAMLAVILGLLGQAVVATVTIVAVAGRQRALPLGPALTAGWLVGVLLIDSI